MQLRPVEGETHCSKGIPPRLHVFQRDGRHTRYDGVVSICHRDALGQGLKAAQRFRQDEAERKAAQGISLGIPAWVVTKVRRPAGACITAVVGLCSHAWWTIPRVGCAF